MIAPNRARDHAAGPAAARDPMCRRDKRRGMIAILAAYALLWQAFLGCVTSADFLAPANLALSASLCTADRDGAPQPFVPQHHDRAACCVLCLTPALAGSDADVSHIGAPRIGVTLSAMRVAAAAPLRLLAGDPRQPRAPPAFI
jgi:hypothetical protein